MNESNFRRPQNSPGRNFRIEPDEYDVLFGERAQQRQRQRQATNTQTPRNPQMTAPRPKQPQQRKPKPRKKKRVSILKLIMMSLLLVVLLHSAQESHGTSSNSPKICPAWSNSLTPRTAYPLFSTTGTVKSSPGYSSRTGVPLSYRKFLRTSSGQSWPLRTRLSTSTEAYA